MEDIEQWLSTDVVSRGRPAHKQGLRPAPHPPDGAPRFPMRKRLVLGMTGEHYCGTPRQQAGSHLQRRAWHCTLPSTLPREVPVGAA